MHTYNQNVYFEMYLRCPAPTDKPTEYFYESACDSQHALCQTDGQSGEVGFGDGDFSYIN